MAKNWIPYLPVRLLMFWTTIEDIVAICATEFGRLQTHATLVCSGRFHFREMSKCDNNKFSADDGNFLHANAILNFVP